MIDREPGKDPRRYDYSKPSRYCDIVMKGGITSGVVYPHAVCELAQTYRFKNVGGTSAGAIAAAATAAAERGRAANGFTELAELPHWIGTDGNLERLFQPQKSTRRLHAILLSTIRGGPVRGVLTAIYRHPFATLVGMAPGVALIVLALMDASGALRILAIVLGVLAAALGGAIAVALRLARQAQRAIPENGYGLCSGWAPPDASETEPLTTWLHGRLNQYAGPLSHEGPLTFGDLWAGPGESAPPADPADRHVQLEMMTTNLTNRRAHRLPWDTREWFFDPAEFRKLFPEDVVTWMEEHPRPEPVQPAARQDSRMRRALLRPFRPLPAPEDLPVIVATRMSLSFPVLLSAVPLWRIDMSLKASAVLDDWNRWARAQGTDWNPLDGSEDDWPSEVRPDTRPTAEACWFSDGGIASNFPLHFFDRFVPRWPTFAINLRQFHPDQEKSESDQMENTWMVKDNGGGFLDWWYRWPAGSGRLSSFLSSVGRTMQNRVDEAQMRVPGYRDRVVHVSLTDDEGGMNLTMPPETLAALTERGRSAAERLAAAYTRRPEDGVITWDNHRWVRLRSTLAVLEQMHERIADGIEKPPATHDERTYAELLGRDGTAPPGSYRMTAEKRLLAQHQVAGVMALAENVRDSGQSLSDGSPEPRPEGRILPGD